MSIVKLYVHCLFGMLYKYDFQAGLNTTWLHRVVVMTLAFKFLDPGSNPPLDLSLFMSSLHSDVLKNEISKEILHSFIK